MGEQDRACRGRRIFHYRKLFGMVYVDADRSAKGISLARVRSSFGGGFDRKRSHLPFRIYRTRTDSEFPRTIVETAEHAAAMAARNCRICILESLVRARAL